MRGKTVRWFTVALVFWAAVSPAVFAGPSEKKKITFEQAFLFGQPRLLKPLPLVRGWLDDEYYLLSERDSTDGAVKLFKVSAATGERQVFLNPKDFEGILPKGFSLLNPATRTADYSRMVFRRKGDLYFLDVKAKKFRRITANPAEEKNPTLSPDGRFVAYTRDHNLFAYDLDAGLEYQLTTDGSETVYNGWASWVYYEEILGRSSRYRAFYWSPDGKKLAFLRFDDSPVPVFPIFHAPGPHGKLERTRYPKAGDPNPKVRLGIVDATGGKITWADFDENADEYIAWVFWLPDSKQLTIQWMNRDQDTIRIYLVDPETGKKRQIYEESQPSWVEFFEDLYFFKDGSGFLLRSDKDGWRHLYVYNFQGKLVRRLTKGKWTVHRIARVDEEHGYVYFVADREESTERHLYRVPLKGGKIERLTQEPGTHRVQVSPGGRYFIDTYSNITTPPKMVLRAGDGKTIRQLGDSKTKLMDEYALGKVELFRIPVEGGYSLPARWFLPPDFDPSKKYPVIFSIYGGPGSESVSNSFPYSLRSFYLAQEGAIVLSVDHRGSGHFGKKGIAEMYRNLGKWEMHDWIEVVKWLRKKAFVDASRVAITGGSYGGYMTLMALTYGADYFTHGVSLYPVTDWRLYDTVYTERYMDRPQDNPEGYRFGSVFTHLDKFKGKLLLVHGTIDDNVHMQNSIQFVDEMIKKGKQFRFMVYPGERHGIRNPARRAHLSRMIMDFWRETLGLGGGE
jgi:dipeptidyl-peptidase-4